MKKVLMTLTLAAFLALPSMALAQGGFTGTNGSKMTVAEALKLGDDAWVTLTGKIEKQLGNEKYLFSDGTGSITIEIDDEDWRGVTAGPEDTVEIHGEIDKDFSRREVDVERIVKL